MQCSTIMRMCKACVSGYFACVPMEKGRERKKGRRKGGRGEERQYRLVGEEEGVGGSSVEVRGCR